MRTVTHLDIFVASPGDVGQERERLDKIVTEINISWGRQLNIHLDLIRWETHTHPGFGEDAQDVINRQLPERIDLFIGILWNRFGTPTKRAGSGTEEEFLRAHKQFQREGNPQLKFYFNRTPTDPHILDFQQAAKVQNFRKTISDLGGYYRDYTSLDSFDNLIRASLVNFIQNYNLPRTPEMGKADYFTEFNKIPGFVDVLADMEALLPNYYFHMEKVDEECFSYLEKIQIQNEIANTTKSFVETKVATDRLAEETLAFAGVLRKHYGTGLDLVGDCLSRLPDAINLIRQKDAGHTQDSLRSTIDALHKIAPDFAAKTHALQILKDVIRKAPVITQNLKSANDNLFLTIRQLFERSELVDALIQNCIDQVSSNIAS